MPFLASTGGTKGFGRGRQIIVPTTDPNFNQTVLLLHGDGTNGAQNNTFVDSSSTPKTITKVNNVAQGTFSPFSADEGKWSADFFEVQSSDGITLGTTFGNAISSASSTFTVEAWIFVTSYPSSANRYYNSAIFGIGSTYMNFGVHSDGTLHFYHYDGAPRTVSSPSAITKNEWTHVAAATTGNTTKLFINGIQVASGTYYGHTGSNQQSCIGSTPDANGSTNRQFRGIISNFRFSNSARYPSNFSVPTSPFTNDANTVVLTLQSNRFIDKSSSPYTLTIASTTVRITSFSPFASSAAYSPSVNGGSAFVDSSGGDYLTQNGGSLSLNTTAWTVECWVYPTSFINAQGIWGASNGGGGQPKVAYQVSGSSIIIYIQGSPTISATAPALNQWTHILISRASSGTGYIYYNGVLQTSGAVGTSTVSNPFQWFTNGEGGTTGMAGYISGGRVSNIARHTGSNFSVPSSPPTNDGNTNFLTNFTNAGIFDNTGKNVLETVGNAQIDTTEKKYGTGSMEFDGSGDYLKLPYSPNLKFGTNPYTIEMWIKTTSTAGWLVFDADNNSGIRLSINSNGTGPGADGLVELNEQVSNGDVIIRSTVRVDDGNWHHIAISRDGASGTRLFVDGVFQAQMPSVRDLYGVDPMFIGTRGSLSAFFNGYIDDLRITKGVARYTAAFTPPTQAFQDL